MCKGLCGLCLVLLQGKQLALPCPGWQQDCPVEPQLNQGDPETRITGLGKGLKVWVRFTKDTNQLNTLSLHLQSEPGEDDVAEGNKAMASYVLIISGLTPGKTYTTFKLSGLPGGVGWGGESGRHVAGS